MGTVRRQHPFLFAIMLLDALFLFGSGVQHAGAQELGWLWRPSEPPNMPTVQDEKRAAKLADEIDYSNDDMERLWVISTNRNPDRAADFLIDYIAKYEAAHAVPELLWARAIFCLGLTRTDEAGKHLQQLWDRYDQRLASGDWPEEPTSRFTVRPLTVIGDALHFSLHKENIREWFNDRIKETVELEQRNPGDRAALLRLRDRTSLAFSLYRWDLVDSATTGAVLLPERLTAFDPFGSCSVDNISRSAERVVFWARKLHPIKVDTTEQEWVATRKSHVETKFDYVAASLGRPLALALWSEYLQDSKVTGIKDVEHRLWLTAIGCLMASVMEQGSWTPDLREQAFLESARVYVQDLPAGYLPRTQAIGLMKMTYYMPGNQMGDLIARVRALPQLSENDLLSGEVEAALVKDRIARTRSRMTTRPALTQPRD